MTPYFRIGVITSTHGLRGEVKVFPTTDDITRFSSLETCILDTGREKKTLHLEHVHFSKGMAIIKFEEYSDISEVEGLRRCELLVTREHALPLEKGEYYIADLLGMKVVTEEHMELGTLDDVMQTGANDVYIVKTKDKRELLLPAIPDCIRKVDLKAGVMTVHLLDGLLDL